MDDAVERYCAATETGATDDLWDTLAPGAELVSPISGRMVFRGEDDLRILLAAVYGTVKELRWSEIVGSGDTRVAIGSARVLGVRMTDAMVFELAPDGRIARIRPHLRPWLALTLFAAALRPGVLRRALAAGARAANVPE